MLLILSSFGCSIPTRKTSGKLRYLHDCSGCFRLERLPGGTCTHWKAPPFHGAHPQRTAQKPAVPSQPRDADASSLPLCLAALYETRFTPGGHVPSPGGRIEGAVAFGQ